LQVAIGATENNVACGAVSDGAGARRTLGNNDGTGCCGRHQRVRGKLKDAEDSDRGLELGFHSDSVSARDSTEERQKQEREAERLSELAPGAGHI
jgi:hypothetical protein